MSLSLEQAHSLSIGELAALSPANLLAIQSSATERLRQIKTLKDWIDGAIALKYEQRVHSLRQQHGKETGVIRFEDDGIEVCADIAKRPQWDQKKLADIAERVRVNGEDPLEFMTVTYKVPESKYKAWPEHLKSIFRDARTLNLGKQSVVLSRREGAS